MTDANFKALIENLPQILLSLGGLIAAIAAAAGSFLNGRKIDVVARKTEAATAAAATAAVIATAAAKDSAKTGSVIVDKLDLNHSQINGRVDQLLNEAKSAAHAAGVVEGGGMPAHSGPVEVRVVNDPAHPVPVAESPPGRPQA